MLGDQYLLAKLAFCCKLAAAKKGLNWKQLNFRLIHAGQLECTYIHGQPVPESATSSIFYRLMSFALTTTVCTCRVFVGEKPHPKAIPSDGLFNGTVILAPNDGICQDGSLGQYFGLGSETRLTSHFIPDPYGIVVGDPSAPPEGFQERWVLNVHAIDTRSALDRKGCTECR